MRRFPFSPSIRRSSLLMVAALLLNSAGVTGPLQGQVGASEPATIISGGPTCTDCEIERYQLATIHDRLLEGGAIVDGGGVHVNRDGTFLVIAGPQWGELFLADEKGAIIRQIGRSGEGPGEYLAPFSVAELANRFVVFDPPLARVTWLTKDDLQVMRTVRMPSSSAVATPAVFPDGSYAWSGSVPTRDGVGYPLHVVAPDGSVQRSFGEGPPPTIIAPSGDSALWAAHSDRYRVEKWHRDGRMLGVYEREVDWFPSPADDSSPKAGDLSVRISGVSEDRQGRLWVHVMVRTLREVTVSNELGEERTVLRLDPDPRSSEEVIEILDPLTATVVANRRIPSSRALSSMDGHYQQELRSTDRGPLLIDVWQTRLVAGKPSHLKRGG